MRFWWRRAYCERCPKEILPTEPQVDVGGCRYHFDCYPRATPPHVTHFSRIAGSRAPVFWVGYREVESGVLSIPSEWEELAARAQWEARMFGCRRRRMTAGHGRRTPSLRELLASVQPALAAAALLVVTLTAPALVHHFPAEIGFLNTLPHVGNTSCTDPETGTPAVCQVFVDPKTGIRYYALYREERLWRVWRMAGETAELIWHTPPQCREGQICI